MSEALRASAEAARHEALERLDKGDFAGALVRYDAALALAKETGDPAFVDWMYVCRAAAAAETGPAADELVELKRILLRTRDPQTAFRAAYSSASIYRLKRERAKVSFYANLARRHAEEIGDARLVAACLNEVGNALAADSRFEEAAASYREALARTDGRSDLTVPRAQWSDNLGYCLIALDRVADGLALVHAALDTLEKADARGFTVYPLLDLSFGYLKQDRYPEARFFGEEGLSRVAAAAGDLEAEKNFLYLLGEACHLAGDAPAAQGYFDRLARLYPEFRNLRAYLDVFDFRNVINLRS